MTLETQERTTDTQAQPVFIFFRQELKGNPRVFYPPLFCCSKYKWEDGTKQC